jgi:ammonium transporter, Amt family
MTKILRWLMSASALALILSCCLFAPAHAQDEPAETVAAASDAPALNGGASGTEIEVAEEAAEEEDSLATLRGETDLLWMCIAAFLVFFMQAGFTLVEAGFTRAKNTVNIVMKNMMDFSMGSLAFWAVGFGLMFGATTTGFFGTDHFFVSGTEGGSFDHWTAGFWMFQVVFAATAATIVSGAMAERTKFIGYLIYSVVITALIYPVFGSWAWGSLFQGDGWLEGKGFIDFAGSTVVHSVGGWAALAGAMILGPRIGKYSSEGRPQAIPGHSIPLAALGVFILWLGWFGFNAGSTTAVGGGEFARVAVTTNLAAAAGAIAAMISSWILSPAKKPDVGMTLNGALAGLVGITCPCFTVTFAGAVAIGLVAGLIVYLSVLFFDRIRIDDPVGAISVHGVCGAWGTLAAGLFGAEKVLGIEEANTGLFYGGGVSQLGVQALGVAACFGWVMATCLLLFGALKVTGLLRVSREHEIEGLDRTEHAASAYQLGDIRA